MKRSNYKDLSGPFMLDFPSVSGKTVCTDITMTGCFALPRPSSPCNAIGMHRHHSACGVSWVNRKPGSATLKFFQKVSSSFPNWSTWSSVPPAMKKWPPWLKMVSAQSERKTTGYSMGICVGLLLDSRYMVWTFDILTGRALVKPRIVEWRFLQLWLSRLDLPHLAIFFSKGSDRPWWRV